MGNRIEFSEEAREKLAYGIKRIAKAVQVTLGPKGRNVIIDRGEHEPPHVTKDGVTVARAVSSSYPEHKLAIRLVQSVASKTNDDAGDGTTTATVLAHGMVKHGLKSVLAGASAVDVKRGMELGVSAVIAELQKQSIAVDGDITKIENVATISANNDAVIGKLIADAMSKVNNSGIITVEESKCNDTYVDVVEGMQLECGYMSPYFITDEARATAQLDNPYVLVLNHKLNHIQELTTILECVAEANRSLLIIAEDVSNEAVSALAVNKLRGAINVVVCKAPGFGDKRSAALADVAAITGAYVLTRTQPVDAATSAVLGTAEKVIVSKNTTTVVGSDITAPSVCTHLDRLKALIQNATNDLDRAHLQERYAKITGGVAVLYIGASSEVEMKEKKDRVDDALAATRAAVEEGIVPGGGVAYIRALSALNDLRGDNSDQTMGIGIIRDAITTPLKQIAINAGKSGDVIVDAVKKCKGNVGYNARLDIYEDLLEAGIIDPTKVARVALENAASIAAMVLTTECTITDDDE